MAKIAKTKALATTLEEVTVEEPAHAILSPSSSSMWIACPGSVRAQAPYRDKEDDSNEASRLGTAAHALLEACLLLQEKPELFIGDVFGKGLPPVDQDMCDAVQVALDWVEEYFDTYGFDNLELYVERKLPIGYLVGVEDADCNGTSDITIEHKDGSTLVVIDYKHGAGIKVWAEKNPQLLLYAASAKRSAGRKFKNYKIVIVQPRAAKKNPVDEWTFTDSFLNKWLRDVVTPSAKAALRDGAPRNAGDHCRWCKASATCRERRQRAIAVAGTEFTSVVSEDELTPPEAMTEEELSRVVREAVILTSWANSVLAYALNRMSNGVNVPGFKLGWTSRRREWDPEQEHKLHTWLAKKKSITVDMHSPRTMLSPPQMEKLLRQVGIIERKKRNGPEPENPLLAFIKYSIPKAKIVPDDAALDFDSVVDDET